VAALPAADVLARDLEPYAILEFPQLFEHGRMSRDALLLMQIIHHKRSASLPLDRISSFVDSARQAVRGNPIIQSLTVLAGTNGPDERLWGADLEPTGPELSFQRRWLVDKGFKRLVITYRELQPQAAADIRAYCRHVLGPPLFQDELQEIYQITEMPAQGEP